MRGTRSAFQAASGIFAGDRTREEANRLIALALDQAMQDRPGDALPLFERLCGMQPHEPAHAINLGNACLAGGNVEGAVQAFAEAGRRGGTGIEYWLGHGLAMLATRRFAEAGPLLRRAYEAEPQAPDVALGWAQYLIEMERFEEAHRCLLELDADRLAPSQRQDAAWLLAQCGHEQTALRLFRACIQSNPADAMPRLQFALLLERLNRLEEAGGQLRAVAKVDACLAPLHALAVSRWSRRTGRPREALSIVQACLSVPTGDEMSAQLHFEAAKLHDQAGRPDEAMQALAHAHTSARRAFAIRQPQFQEDHMFGWLDQRLDAGAPPAWRRQPRVDGPQDPIFLVGFPRSGTTLLQHVLSMHPRVRAVEEKPVLEDVIHRMEAESTDGQTLLQRLDCMDSGQLAGLRMAYWRGMAEHADEEGRRLLDKYPLSLTRIPYIARLFPASHTLCLLRHPCDVVLSCYMQAFGLNGGALAFSSLASAAHAYVRVMSYWEEQKQRVGCDIHVLRYEDLVADFAGAMQDAVRFLVLPWCNAFGDFHSQAAGRPQRIRTPSYAQVIQPINARSVHRWRRYRRHFEGEVLELLSPWVRRYGYSLE